MQTLGEKIRELREAKDLSLRELARAIEVSAAFLSDVELGRRFPSDDLLAKIARKLSIPVDELRTFDSRAPVDELRRRASTTPAFGFMLRRMVDEGVSSEELERFLRERQERERKKRG